MGGLVPGLADQHSRGVRMNTDKLLELRADIAVSIIELARLTDIADTQRALGSEAESPMVRESYLRASAISRAAADGQRKHVSTLRKRELELIGSEELA